MRSNAYPERGTVDGEAFWAEVDTINRALREVEMAEGDWLLPSPDDDRTGQDV
jgi:hypothetical protein